MAYFNFERLINKYTTEFKALIPSSGGYNEYGEYVKGNTEELTLYGAIINLSENKVYRSEGTLTSQDKILYMNSPIPFPLKNATIIHNNKKYSIEQENENAEFTNVWAYTLKYVSAFDNKEVGE